MYLSEQHIIVYYCTDFSRLLNELYHQSCAFMVVCGYRSRKVGTLENGFYDPSGERHGVEACVFVSAYEAGYKGFTVDDVVCFCVVLTLLQLVGVFPEQRFPDRRFYD